jgi:hypothetical protein
LKRQQHTTKQVHRGLKITDSGRED